MENLPATIGNPTSTEEVSTVVMATDTPTWIIETSAAAPTTSGDLPSAADAPSGTIMGQTTSMSTGSDGASGAVAVPEHTTSRSSLTTPQIAGIAIGGAALAVVVFGLLVLLVWIRKRRRQRRRSQRRSRLVEPSSPVNHQSPDRKPPPIFENVETSLTVPNTQSRTQSRTQGRFYAPQQSMEEKRRSFWRKSIRPEEIGIAVSPKMPGEHSPVSTSSQQSFSRLLPIAPAVLWPAPLDVEATRERRRYTQRPVSDATEFDDEPETRRQEPERILVDNQPFILEKPPLAKRPRGPPPNLRLPALPESPPKAAGQTARIPLTPTYDNGNVDLSSPRRNFQSPTSQSPLPVAEHKLPPSSMYANRSVLRKKPPARLPLRVINTPPGEPLMQPRNPPLPPQIAPQPPAGRRLMTVGRDLERQSSVSSIYTEIEEDTTPPEEANKQLGLRVNPPTPSVIPADIRGVSPAQESPIKDLRYPQIPRSAAISRQAQRPAQLRASLNPAPASAFVPVAASPLRPTRDQLVHAELSFMQTDTTSSDGYLSDEIIEFPIPPSSKTHKPSITKLRGNPSSGNRGPPMEDPGLSLNEALSTSTSNVNVVVPQRSPSSKARLTPSKSSSGDLYLTVEI
ncbi:uncharacterized protein Z519_05994 [Cladophialophora bantiana CBS 173.52]|uniref:Uncharacterized protein n=1 Tax=Cladophialophora bantiana (strain ATCC 10958 / CBS 173.52 / CDC B-1940 / NIH 8579) TaxID=1442370 RepID=A0A0D2I9D0_CLAB1|nr:uncharacterized protein Z519_05994 [Cladophialophora bantiana CBS 173.52]KIW93389.1 hypothetical protein Z519_05994 [Cladophialophora bantiana CBS 173.52]